MLSPAAQISVFAHSLCPIACCNRFETRFIGDRLELSKYRSHVGGARAAHGRVNQHVATQEQRNLQIEDRLRALLRRRASGHGREGEREGSNCETHTSERASERKEGRKEGRVNHEKLAFVWIPREGGRACERRRRREIYR